MDALSVFPASQLAKLVRDAVYVARDEGNLEIALALAMAREPLLRHPSPEDQIRSWPANVRKCVERERERDGRVN